MKRQNVTQKTHTWCPEQIVPFGILALKGLCTGHDVRGPHREDPGNGTELKLFGCPLHGLQCVGGGGRGPWSDVIDGPCASIGRCGCIDIPGGICPGPGP